MKKVNWKMVIVWVLLGIATFIVWYAIVTFIIGTYNLSKIVILEW